MITIFDKALFMCGYQTRRYTIWAINTYLNSIHDSVVNCLKIIAGGGFVMDLVAVKKHIHSFKTELGNIKHSISEYHKNGKLTDQDQVKLTERCNLIRHEVDLYQAKIKEVRDESRRTFSKAECPKY